MELLLQVQLGRESGLGKFMSDWPVCTTISKAGKGKWSLWNINIGDEFGLFLVMPKKKE